MSTIAYYYFAFNERRSFKIVNINDLEKQIDDRQTFKNEWEEIPSMFEIIYKDDYVKIFMDIENYSYEKLDILTYTINKFKQYFNIRTGLELGKYILTENKNSRHQGKSFHVIFPEYKLKFSNLRKLIYGFVESHKMDVCFNDRIIDTSIYTDRRLFRLPYQHGICGCGKNEIQYSQIRARDSETWKNWLQIYGDKNYHQFVTLPGETEETDLIKKSVIKYTDECKEITTQFTCSAKFKPAGTSGNFNKNVNVNIDIVPIVETITKGFNSISQTKEDLNVDSKIKVALMSLGFRESLSKNESNLIKSLKQYYAKNNTYEGFVNDDEKLTKDEVFKLLQFVFGIKE